MCRWRRPLYARGLKAVLQGKPLDKGIKGFFHFGCDIEKVLIAQHCISHGNPSKGPKGFETIGGNTLAELAVNKDLEYLANEIYEQAKQIVKVIDDARSNHKSQ
jgi:hypothetical protein